MSPIKPGSIPTPKRSQMTHKLNKSLKIIFTGSGLIYESNEVQLEDKVQLYEDSPIPKPWGLS